MHSMKHRRLVRNLAKLEAGSMSYLATVPWEYELVLHQTALQPVHPANALEEEYAAWVFGLERPQNCRVEDCWIVERGGFEITLLVGSYQGWAARLDENEWTRALPEHLRIAARRPMRSPKKWIDAIAGRQADIIAFAGRAVPHALLCARLAAGPQHAETVASDSGFPVTAIYPTPYLLGIRAKSRRRRAA